MFALSHPHSAADSSRGLTQAPKVVTFGRRAWAPATGKPSLMTQPRHLMMLIAVTLSVSGPSLAQAQSDANQEIAPTRPISTRFKCQDGGELRARFAIADARLVAIVDPGDGPHALPVRPWTSGPAMLTWTDGQRTLTWSPGVQIMWMDGGTHRMCGRGEHKH